MKNIRKKIIAFLLALECLAFCISFNSKVYASWSPVSEWKENGYPTEVWRTDTYSYHQIGFINDPKNNQLLIYVNMCPDPKPNKNSRPYNDPYNDPYNQWLTDPYKYYQTRYHTLQPAGYNINIGNATYQVTLDVNPWNIQNGKSGYAGIRVWDPQTNQYKVIKDNLCHYYANSYGSQSAIIKIPYNVFNRDDLNRSTKMTMQNPNLGGNTKITISGASTGPYIPAIIAFVLASIAAISYYHKRKLVRHEHQ